MSVVVLSVAGRSTFSSGVLRFRLTGHYREYPSVSESTSTPGRAQPYAFSTAPTSRDPFRLEQFAELENRFDRGPRPDANRLFPYGQPRGAQFPAYSMTF